MLSDDGELLGVAASLPGHLLQPGAQDPPHLPEGGRGLGEGGPQVRTVSAVPLLVSGLH